MSQNQSTSYHLLDSREAACFLSISMSSLRRRLSDGSLAYRRIGKRILFTHGDLETFLENCAVTRKLE